MGCEQRVPLCDEMEHCFASPEIQQRVRDLQEESAIVLSNQSKERALVGEVISTVALADQISREFNISDQGIDMEIEFTDDAHEATGAKLYLQLKSGDPCLRERKSDGAENFTVKDGRHARYWMAQASAGAAGSRAWVLAQSNRGEQLFAAGQVAEAAEIFQKILAQLGDAPTYERALTLGRLGRCLEGRDEGAGLMGMVNLSKALGNLADLLQTEPGRLAEARQLADEALAIKQTLDPGAAEIWKTYELLAQIAEKEALVVPASGDSGAAPAQAGATNQPREYRRLAPEAQRNFAGTRHQLRRFALVILATIGACVGQEEGLQAVKQFQQQMAKAGPDLRALAAALDRILAGERDEAMLCEGLNPGFALVVETILAGLADPTTLADLLPAGEAEPE